MNSSSHVTMNDNTELTIESEKKFTLSENQQHTVRHAFKVLNKIEIINILEAFQVKLDLDKIRRKDEIEDFILYNFSQGNYVKELFEEIRSEAFNPNLENTDGFFTTYIGTSSKMNSKNLRSFIKEYNQENGENEIILNKYSDQKIQILAVKKTEKLIFDRESMYSVPYEEEKKALCEIYPNKGLVYIQTTNTVIYSAIKTIIKGFLNGLFETDDLKFAAPKMSQTLSFTYNDDMNSATTNREVHPNTIKLLDILLELQTANSAFSNFECTTITFDHEDIIKRQDAKSKVLSQTYGGGDLLFSDSVKSLILSKRIIFEVEFNIVFSYVDGAGYQKKHSVTAGIINKRKGALRIFIKNSDYGLKQVMKRAYKELKNVFVENYDNKTLRNEDKIKKLLGLS